MKGFLEEKKNYIGFIENPEKVFGKTLKMGLIENPERIFRKTLDGFNCKP